MVDVDDLHSNPFFKYLQTGNALEQAAIHQYIVCVPLAASLGSRPLLDKEFALAHIFKPTDTRSVFAALTPNKRTVQITEKAVTTLSGFPENRTVNIATSEQYYDESFRSFTILRLEYPLIGRVSQAYLDSLKPLTLCPTPVESRSLLEHESVITKMLGKADPATTTITSSSSSSGSGFVVGQPTPVLLNEFSTYRLKYAKEFTSTYVMVKGFEPQTGEKVSVICI